MKILIIGAGDVGFQIANMLSKEEHEVSVIDNDLHRVNNIREKIDAKVILGSGTNALALEEAGIISTDLFIAVSSVDEVNIMSCLLAKEYKVDRCVARVGNIDYILDGSKLNGIELGIERVVNPQIVVAEEVCEHCDFANASEVARFLDDQFYHLGYPLQKNSPLIGKKLKGLSSFDNEKIMVITSLRRNDETFVPTRDETLRVGDTLFFFCRSQDLKEIEKYLGADTHDTKKVFLIGGGKIGYQVAKKLEETKHKVKVFDHDPDICHQIAEDLDVEVYCTGSTDTETLVAEGIENVDVAVTMMNDENSNILTALLAKKLGAFKVISLVNSKRLTSLAYSLGVNSTISPRLATASSILKFIRRGNINSVVEKTEGEILEIVIDKNVELTSSNIKLLSKPEGVIFGGIKRDGNVELISGDTQIQRGDVLVVYSLANSVSHLEKLIQV
jgi:trk system potassium uptake protein TrkA